MHARSTKHPGRSGAAAATGAAKSPSETRETDEILGQPGTTQPAGGTGGSVPLNGLDVLLLVMGVILLLGTATILRSTREPA